MNLRRSEIDLTQGSVWKQIARFAWPLLIGNIFQQMYNTVDSIVLGQYVNKEALAAVGSVGSSINAIIGFFIGIATGAGVVIAQYCGAKDDRKLSDAVQTTMVVALAACVICTFLGNLSVPLFLKIMKMEKTPEVYKMADRYLRIYFWGVSGMLLYNVGAGILRAVGDSLRPLIFLIITTVINTVLDILFVTKYNWEIEGVAYATVIAQFISAFMVLYVLTSSHMAYRVDWLRLRVDRSILAAILKSGFRQPFSRSSPASRTCSCRVTSTCSARIAWRAGRHTARSTSLRFCPSAPSALRRRRLPARTSARVSGRGRRRV